MPADSSVDTPSPARSLSGRSRLGALAYRDFRLLWSGLIVSNTGSWMQYLAQGWLVVELAQSASQGALYLGLVGLVRAAPVLALSGFAGTLADRMDRRRILLVANGVMGLCALGLAVLAQSGAARIWEVMAVASLSSAAAAFDAPTRQSLVPLIVGERDLMNAIGLNSAAFNGPAIVGPAIAGVLVAAIGLAPCFYINAASYIGVLLAIVLMEARPPIEGIHRPGIRQELLEGIRYMRGSGAPFVILALSTLVAFVARPYIQLLPSFAKSVIGGGPAALGVLGSAAGAGALAGSITTAFIGLRHYRGVLLLVCAAAAGGSLALFGMTRTSAEASVALVLLGGTIMLFMGMANTLLQTYTILEMRGRVMALYTMTFLGLMPLGTWVLGSVASVITLPATFVGAGALICAVAMWAAYAAPDLRLLD